MVITCGKPTIFKPLTLGYTKENTMGSREWGFITMGTIALLWVAGAYFYFYYKNKKAIVMPGMGALRHDDDVIVPQRRVVVNFVFANEESIDQELVADMVVNVDNVLKGIYKPTEKMIKQNETASWTDHQSDPGEEEEDLEVDVTDAPELNPDIKEEDIPIPEPVRNVSEPVAVNELSVNF